MSQSSNGNLATLTQLDRLQSASETLRSMVEWCLDAKSTEQTGRRVKVAAQQLWPGSVDTGEVPIESPALERAFRQRFME
jgi:hypothetical protein